MANIRSMEDERLRLKWDDFQENIQTHFRELRGDSDFTDVTLVCEDQSVKAHKVIISACSPFFKRLLKSHPNPQPLIYMRGVKAKDLTSLVDFIYLGEASMLNEQLEGFLALAEDLELKGLSGGSHQEETPVKRNSVAKEDKSLNRNQQNKSVNWEKMMKEGGISNVKCENIFDEFSSITLDQKAEQPVYIGSDTTAKIDSNIVKHSDGFSCTRCEYSSKRKNHMREHVERHIEGLEYPCKFCDKNFKTSNSLRNHNYRSHMRHC